MARPVDSNTITRKLDVCLAQLRKLKPEVPTASNQIGPTSTAAVLDSVIARLIGIRNSIPPIARLPAETLCTIFEWISPGAPFAYGMRGDWGFTHSPWILPLRHVSSHWNAVITSHPPLWSYIQSFKGSTQWLDLCLSRSAHHPLTIKKYIASKSSELDLFLERISPHTSRIRNLEISSTAAVRQQSREESFITKSLAVCKTLRSLRITARGYSFYPPIEVSLGDHLADIRTLELHGLMVPKSFPTPLARLDRLTLEHLQGSLNSLIDLLPNCPNLSQLQIDCFRSSRYPVYDFDTIQVVELACLTYFKCAGLTAKVTAAMLKQIRMPRLHTLLLAYRAKDDSTGETDILEALGGMETGTITSVEVLQETGLLFTTSGMVVYLERGDHGWGSVFQWMSGRTAPELFAAVHCSGRTAEQVLEGLHTARLPIAELRFPDTTDFTRLVALFLHHGPAADQSPMHPDKDQGKPPLPSLRRLRIILKTDLPEGLPVKVTSVRPGLEVVRERPSDRDLALMDALHLREREIDFCLETLERLGYTQASTGSRPLD